MNRDHLTLPIKFQKGSRNEGNFNLKLVYPMAIHKQGEERKSRSSFADEVVTDGDATNYPIDNDDAQSEARSEGFI